MYHIDKLRQTVSTPDGRITNELKSGMSLFASLLAAKVCNTLACNGMVYVGLCRSTYTIFIKCIIIILFKIRIKIDHLRILVYLYLGTNYMCASPVH